MSFDTRCVKTGTRVMICTGVDSNGTGSKGQAAICEKDIPASE